jgi:hypothetical protein
MASHIDVLGSTKAEKGTAENSNAEINAVSRCSCYP